MRYFLSELSSLRFCPSYLVFMCICMWYFWKRTFCHEGLTLVACHIAASPSGQKQRRDTNNEGIRKSPGAWELMTSPVFTPLVGSTAGSMLGSATIVIGWEDCGIFSVFEYIKEKIWCRHKFRMLRLAHTCCALRWPDASVSHFILLNKVLMNREKIRNFMVNFHSYISKIPPFLI